MATWIKVRAISRSQNIRIGRSKLSRGTYPTPSATVASNSASTLAVNLDDAKVRRDLEHHLAVGSIVVVGTGTLTPGIAITSGAVVDQGVSATDLALRVTAGVLTLADGTTTVAIVAGTPSVSAADATNPRIDNVVVNNSTGVVTIVAGTAAATPVAPAIAANTTRLATVSVPANDTAITNDQIFEDSLNRFTIAVTHHGQYAG